MTPYRPASTTQVAVGLGVWQAAGEPNRTVTILLDPRLATWLVNKAAKRTSLTYTVELGTPPLLVQLV